VVGYILLIFEKCFWVCYTICMSGREHLFSVKISDCRVDTFRAGGKGGQNQNKRDSGVRVVHEPSGAVGVARDQRSQLQNKRSAFSRMAGSVEFRRWAWLAGSGLEPIDALVDRQLDPVNLLVEVRGGKGWVVVDGS
jgi:hypothetical protein